MKRWEGLRITGNLSKVHGYSKLFPPSKQDKPSCLTLWVKTVSQCRICCSYSVLSQPIICQHEPLKPCIFFIKSPATGGINLILVRCVATHFSFMNSLRKHCRFYFFFTFLFLFFGLGRNKWAPGNDLAGHTA